MESIRNLHGVTVTVVNINKPHRPKQTGEILSFKAFLLDYATGPGKNYFHLF